LQEALHCIATHPTSDLVAIGSRTPNFYVYNTSTREEVTTGSCGDEQLECAGFSPGEIRKDIQIVRAPDKQRIVRLELRFPTANVDPISVVDLSQQMALMN